VICVQCEASLEAGSKFCDACGAKQSQGSPVAAAILTPPAPPAGMPGQVGAEGSAAPTDDFDSVMSDVTVLGSAEPNAHYLGQRLQYTEGAETFDAGEALHRQTMAQLKIHAILSGIVFLVGLVAAGIAYWIGGKALVTLLILVLVAFTILLLVAPLVRRQNFAVSEWKMLIDGKGGSADGVYDHIAAGLVARQTPVQYRAVNLPDIWWRGYLQVRMGAYSAFVTCFPFGQDLYIGWTVWWSMSWLGYRRSDPNRGLVALVLLPWRIVADMLTGRASTYELSYVHQYDEAKALRECVHAVTRQGVEAAVGLVPLRGKGTIGSAVPEGPAPKFVSAPTFTATVGQNRG